MPCYSPPTPEERARMQQRQEEKAQRDLEHQRQIWQDAYAETEQAYRDAIDNWHVVQIPAGRQDCTPRAVLDWLEAQIGGRYLWNTLNEVTFAPREPNDPWWDRKMAPQSRARVLRFELEEDQVFFKMVWG